MLNDIIAYIGIGSNLNNPITQVRYTISSLNELPESKIVATSSLYHTSPVNVEGQPDYFVNAVVALSTRLSSQQLLQEILALENIAGRAREPGKVTSRILDNDLLLYGNQVINDINLKVPHPRMYNRGFVLIPLYEIAPELVFPNGKGLQSIVEEWQQQYSDIVTRIENE